LVSVISCAYATAKAGAPASLLFRAVNALAQFVKVSLAPAEFNVAMPAEGTQGETVFDRADGYEICID